MKNMKKNISHESSFPPSSIESHVVDICRDSSRSANNNAKGLCSGAVIAEGHYAVTPEDDASSAVQYLGWWSLLVDVIIWSTGFSIFMVATQTADDHSKGTNNAEVRFPLTLTHLTLQFIVWMLLAIFLYWAREEPEISTKNKSFLVQVTLCSGLLILSRFFGLLMEHQYIPSDIYSNTIISGFGVQAYYGLISAILLRLRLIYKIFARNDFHPVYCTGLLYHIPLIAISAVPLYVCNFSSLKCSVTVYYTGSWIIWSFYMTEFAFYLWHVRPVPGLFVDFGSNVRIYCFMFGTFIGGTIYTFYEGQPLVIRDLYYFMFPFGIYIALFETFGLISIKVLGRKWGTHWLKDVCLQGVAGTFLSTKRKTMDFVLSDPFVLQKLQNLAKKRQFEESVAALIECRVIAREVDKNNLRAAGHMIEQWMNKHVTGDDTSQHINISATNRSALLKEVERVHDAGIATKEMLEALLEAEQNVIFMLRAHVVTLFNTEEVVQYCLRLLALIKVGLLISEGEKNITSGTKAKTVNTLTDTTHTIAAFTNTE